MNLRRLFSEQKALDKKIIEGKDLQGEDLLDRKILALLVELGELANKWRGFKFWSDDQKPRKNIITDCNICENAGVKHFKKCSKCDGYGYFDSDRVLEEYVDCLHFILSIGNDMGKDKSYGWFDYEESSEGVNDIQRQFKRLFMLIANSHDYIYHHYDEIIYHFIVLGRKLGYTWSEIEQAYFAKNEKNHKRQDEGY